jgi:uncharacterized protein YecT (DUF1311 family)
MRLLAAIGPTSHPGHRHRPNRRRFLVAAALACWTSSRAIDNPDAPDRSAAFLARAQPYEERLSQASRTSDIATAASAYAEFLDGELNTAYQDLLGRVGDSSTRRALMQSQREWLQFRDAELRFVDRNWTPKNFGSSYVLSRAGYWHQLIKQRVSTLLAYLQNYPAVTKTGK